MKNTLKKFFQAFSYLLMLPAATIYKLSRTIIGERKALPIFTQSLSLLPGLPGSYLRIGFYRQIFTYCSRDCHIGFLTVFSTDKVSIARNVSIGNFCSFGEVQIGANCEIASRVSTISGRHQHQPSEDNQFRAVFIGAGCWLGEGCIVAANISADSTIGAGAVVVKPIGKEQTAVGNPAKAINS